MSPEYFLWTSSIDRFPTNKQISSWEIFKRFLSLNGKQICKFVISSKNSFELKQSAYWSVGCLGPWVRGPSDKVWLSAADGWAREANTWLADWQILSTNFGKHWCAKLANIVVKCQQILSQSFTLGKLASRLTKPTHRIQMACWGLVWWLVRQ